MKFASDAPLGFVADGHQRYTRSKEFRARERAVRVAVIATFGPRLAEADGWMKRWWVRWERLRALRRALSGLYPSPYSFYLRGAGAYKGEPLSGAR